MISVIIPTFNRADTIKRAIESVLNQTYKDLELIIVDDGSTDNTEKIVAEYIKRDNRVVFNKLAENQGACAARNVGINMAKGKYIAFQDSDSEWLPEKLEKQLTCINEHGADICICSEKKYSLDGRIIYRPYNFQSSNSRFLTHQEICEKNGIITPALFAKSEVFLDCYFDPNVKRQQDYEWGIRASKKYKVWFENTVLVYDYLQKDSISNSGSKVLMEAREYIIKKHFDVCQQYPEFYINQLRIIGSQKALLGLDDKEEYRKICQIRGTLADYLKYLLSVVRLRQKYYKIKNRKKHNDL